MDKAELHCHLDGIPGLAMVQEIRQQDPTFPINPMAFKQAGPIESPESFFAWLEVIDPIEGELDHFYPILGRHISALKAQSVRYAEIMIGSSEIPGDTGEALEKLGALRRWVTEQEAGETQVEFLMVFCRPRSPETVAQLAEKTLVLYEAGLLTGVALAGRERGFPVQPFQKSLARLKEAGLGIEIHAGEWCGPESVWEALEHGYPDRIGHGLSIFQDPALLDAVRERGIHIEMCPTSNLVTGAVRCIEEHPVAQARELGLDFSINTDDPGPFRCSMESEYALLAQVLGFTERDFLRIYRNALGARFQPELRIELGPAETAENGMSQERELIL
jgi:adenosine deaminase